MCARLSPYSVNAKIGLTTRAVIEVKIVGLQGWLPMSVLWLSGRMPYHRFLLSEVGSLQFRTSCGAFGT
jgi:hypothetical protein